MSSKMIKEFEGFVKESKSKWKGPKFKNACSKLDQALSEFKTGIQKKKDQPAVIKTFAHSVRDIMKTENVQIPKQEQEWLSIMEHVQLQESPAMSGVVGQGYGAQSGAGAGYAGIHQPTTGQAMTYQRGNATQGSIEQRNAPGGHATSQNTSDHSQTFSVKQNDKSSEVRKPYSSSVNVTYGKDGNRSKPSGGSQNTGALGRTDEENSGSDCVGDRRRTELDDLQGQLYEKDDEIRKLNQKNLELEQDKESKTVLLQKVSTYERQISDMRKKEAEAAEETQKVAKETQNKIEEKDGVIEALRKDLNQISVDKKQLSDEFEHLKKKYKHELNDWQSLDRDQKDEIKKLKSENNDLTSRFSELASEKLKHGNPDIVDLGDPHRAMKLADRYSAIYNDVWTDAFIALQELKMSEKSASEYLLRGLIMSFRFCQDKARMHMEQLENLILYPCQDLSAPVKQGRGNQQPSVSSSVKKSLIEARRQMASVNGAAIVKEYMSSIDKQAAGEDRKRISACKEYNQGCAELSWYMVIHDPPLVLKTDIKNGSKLDTNLFTPLHKGNKVDYLVWPALLNGEGGGVLSKGAVEIKK